MIGFPVEQSERAECENQTQDYWTVDGLELTRHHVSPRVHKFIPEGVRGFPTSLRNLNPTRKTMGEAYFGKEVFVVRDEWMDEDPYQEPFPQAWTGETIFTMIEKEGDELQAQEPPKKKKPRIPLEPVPEDEEMVDPQEELYQNSWLWSTKATSTMRTVHFMIFEHFARILVFVPLVPRSRF